MKMPIESQIAFIENLHFIAAFGPETVTCVAAVLDTLRTIRDYGIELPASTAIRHWAKCYLYHQACAVERIRELEDGKRRSKEAGAEKFWFCFFCHRPNTEVEFIVDARFSAICNDCVDRCSEIIGEARTKQKETAGDGERSSDG